jgi:hypothetical protein
MARRKHIRQLCIDHSITLRHGKRSKQDPEGTAWQFWDSQGFPCSREIWVPRIRNSKAYWIALHEIGHCVSYAQMTLQEFDALHPVDSELAAWAWALGTTKEFPSEQTKRYIGRSFNTYLEAYLSTLDNIKHRNIYYNFISTVGLTAPRI